MTIVYDAKFALKLSEIWHYIAKYKIIILDIFKWDK